MSGSLAEDEATRDHVELLSVARRSGDLAFFDRVPEKVLHRHYYFLQHVARCRWDAAILLPSLQSCPYWTFVISNQFVIFRDEPDHVEVAEYLLSHCPERMRRSAVTRVSRHYRSAGVTNPPDITAFVDRHSEYLGSPKGSLGDTQLVLTLRQAAEREAVPPG
jgi:hypothetical protein